MKYVCRVFFRQKRVWECRHLLGRREHMKVMNNTLSESSKNDYFCKNDFAPLKKFITVAPL